MVEQKTDDEDPESSGRVAAGRFVHGTLVLDPWAIDVTPEGLLVVLAFVVIAQLIGNTMILHVQRNNQERAQLQVHVHAWRLRQLVRNA